MPPNTRRRGGGFGGNLLAVPTPLPDDEPTSGDKPAGEQPEPVSGSPVPETQPPILPSAQPKPPVAVVVPQVQQECETRAPAHEGSPARRRPPSTIRLDDKAGHPLFDAYVEAKRLDPFLSYRQFASGIVLDGLAAHRRRQKRP